MLQKKKLIFAAVLAVLAIVAIIFIQNQFSPKSSDDQIKQMEENLKLCYQDSDCWVAGDKYVDCNGPFANRYYCEKHVCYMTEMLCPRNSLKLRVCIDNTCSTR